MEVRNRFKGLDLIECLMNYGRRFVAGVQPRQDPGGTLRMNGIGERERERERRHVRPALIGQVCVLLFDNRFYTLSQNVFKVQDAYSWLHRISITSF